MKKEKPSRVTYVIEQRDGMVKLVVTHEGFAEGSKTLPSISLGWPMVLSSLKSILETGQPLASRSLEGGISGMSWTSADSSHRLSTPSTSRPRPNGCGRR
jgi:hypothetical protein